MPDDNEHAVRRVLEWWSARDADVAADALDPEIEVYSRMAAVAGEPYRGLSGFRQWVRDIDDQFELWEIGIDEIRPLGPDAMLVFGPVHARGRGSGVTLDWSAALRVDMRAGRVRRVTIYVTPAEALAAAMSDESATSDLVERTRGVYAALNGRDFDGLASIFGRDSVWDVSRWGLGIHTGPEAVRRFLGDWFETLDQYNVQIEEMHDLGNGVIYAEVLQIARPVGGGGHLHLRSAPVFVWTEGVVAQVIVHRDLDEARATAERLARERE